MTTNQLIRRQNPGAAMTLALTAKRAATMLLMMVLTTAMAWADASGSCGNGVTWSYVAETKILSIAKTGDGTGAMANYYINNQPWREFNITKVVIGEGVTSIGDDAFFVYPSLLSVEIPASVTSIAGSAFYKCTGLTSVSFATGSQLASIGTYAFYNCTNLASITIPNGVTTISNNAFNSAGLTSIAIPASVTSIGSLAFMGCTSLETITVDEANAIYESPGDCNAIIEKTSNTLVIGCKGTTIPDNVTSIGGEAFENCTGLTIIEIPASVTSIGASAFYNCSGLASVIVHATSVPTLGSIAFDRNASGRKIYVPYACQEDYKGAANWSAYSSAILPISDGECGTDVKFSYDNSTHTLSIFGSGNMYNYSEGGAPWKDNCSEIKAVVIGKGVASIGNNAFAGCTSLTSITIPTSVTSIGDQAFKGCTSLPSITIPRGVTNIGQSAFADCTSLTSIEIPTSVTSIGDNAFAGCSGLASVILKPTTPPTLGSDAFEDNASGRKIYVPYASLTDYTANWSTYASNIVCYNGTCGDDVYYSYDSTSKTLNIFGSGNMYNYASFSPTPWDLYKEEIATVVIGNGVMSIGMYAFNSCTDLTSIEIPASVTSIGYSAFAGCTHLATVTLHSNPSIASDAFNSSNPTVTMNLTASGPVDGKYWMTFYNQNYKFQADENIQIFKAALSGSTLRLTELTTDKIVTKDNAVILKSTTGSITMTLVSDLGGGGSNDFSGNSLEGVADARGMTAANPSTTFVLNYTPANGVGFYRLAAGKTIGVGKAYLTYSGAALAREYFLFNKEMTGLKDVIGQKEDDGEYQSSVRGDYYDLQGRKVAQPAKGLYIVNGKKVVIK